MNIKINFKKQVLNKSNANLILFADEKFNISGLKKYISNTEYSYISDILKKKDNKKKIYFQLNQFYIDCNVFTNFDWKYHITIKSIKS